MQGLEAALILKFKVTPRNAEIARLAVSGMTSMAIANMLFITEKTVKYHLTIVYKSANLKGRKDLLEFAKFFSGWSKAEG